MKGIKNAIAEFNAALQKLKAETIEFINDIEEIPVERFQNSSCFVVSFKTITENSGILSPFYYDVKEQKKTLTEIVNNSKHLEFLTTLKEIAETGKRIVRKGTSSYQQIYAPSVVSSIKNFLQEEDLC